MDRTDSYQEQSASAHRRIDAMFEGLLAALRSDANESGDVRAAFAEMREALESHIDQEDRLYYPAVQALRPAHRSAIEGLVEAHQLFRSRLGEIDTSLASGAAGEVESALAAFTAAFAAHEATEERLLRVLDEELARAMASPPT